MTTRKPENPDKLRHPVMVRFDDVGFAKIRNDSDAARLQPAVYIRELALGNSIRISRSLPASDRASLATLLGAMNRVGAILIRIVEELEVGDVPFDAPFRMALQETTSALAAVEAILERLQKAAEAVLSELETS